MDSWYSHMPFPSGRIGFFGAATSAGAATAGAGGASSATPASAVEDGVVAGGSAAAVAGGVVVTGLGGTSTNASLPVDTAAAASVSSEVVEREARPTPVAIPRASTRTETTKI